MKKVVAIILCVLISISTTTISFAINNEPEFVSIDTTSEEGNHFDFRYVDEDGDEIELDEGNSDILLEDSEYSGLVTSTSIPSQYDARDYGLVTSVKDQQPFGSCWAFAFCAAAESSLIAQGYATKDTIDLSEAHLAWFTGNSYVENSNNPVQQDYFSLPTNIFDFGGNSLFAMATVARGSGFTTEEKFPYVNNEDFSAMQFNEEDMFESEYALVSANFIEPEDITDVKKSIMEYGAVASVMDSNGPYWASTPAGYTYHQTEDATADHAITIVGWDDSFPSSYFVSRPENNGAWLVKNSWGTTFSSDGYVWVSYEDTSVSQFCEVVAVPKDYDKIYQYDGIATYSSLAFSQQSQTAYGANIFTAEEDMLVTDCGFNIFNDYSYTCTIQLYKNCTERPTNGEKLEEMAVKCNRAGFYRVEFKNKHRINKGETFSIVIKYYNNNGKYSTAYMPIEKISSNSIYNYLIEPGQSYYSVTGGSWIDCSTKTSYGNIPIKAYTETIPTAIELRIDTLPRTAYMVNDTVNLEGLAISLIYDNNATSAVDMNTISVSDVDMSYNGIKTITLSYGELTTSFDINVFDYEDIIDFENSQAEINTENKTIYNLKPGIKNLDSYLSLNNNFTCETTNAISTGSEIKFFYNNEYLTSLYALIYGDVNSDGWCDGMDAVSIQAYLMNPNNNDWTEFQMEAADCNHDGVIDNKDADLLSNAGLLLSCVSQTNPDYSSEAYKVYADSISQNSISIKEEINNETTNEKTETNTEINEEITNEETTKEETTKEEEKEENFFTKIINSIISFFNSFANIFKF